MQSLWQIGVANARLEFSGEDRFQTFTLKWLLANIEYFEFSGEDRFQTFTLKWLLANIEYFVSFRLKS